MIYLLSAQAALADEQQWEQTRDADGIQVFINKTLDERIIMVKAQTVIDAGLEHIMEIMEDEARRKDWVPYLKSSKRLETYSPTEILQYNHYAAPWPAKDRDFVYRVSRVRNSDGSVTYVMQSVDSPLMPEQPDKVRAILLDSRYLLTPVTERQTRVELLFHADPRGWIPLWIVNLIHRA
ncbi:MAG: hypothetical protein A2V90_01215, partial [Gammaproteobacteria bacterium RBG_16_57_12]